MTSDRYAQERIRTWLVAKAPSRAPDDVLVATFDQTQRLQQSTRRRRWAAIAWRPMPIVFATAVVVVVVGVSGIVGGLRNGLVPLGGGNLPPLGGANGNLPPLGGANRPIGVQFGSSAPISGQWTSDGQVAFTVQFAEPETEKFYWRAAVYDTFDLTAWRQTVTGSLDVEPGTDVLGDTAEAVTDAGSRAITFQVVPEDFRASTIVSPQAPSQVDTPVRVSYVDDARSLVSIDRTGEEPYTVTALVRVRGEGDQSGLTANRLRAAGTSYPEAISQRYLQVPAGAIPRGGAAEGLLERIRAATPDPENPYDVASTMVDYFRSPANFSYDTDVRDLACEGLSTVECFAQYKRGYCQHYATTMAILLRQAGIPTRLVAGFLPGEREQKLHETVRFSAAHTWVEVYFPGYGWVEFDPTGGGIAQAEPLPTGEPVS